MSQATQNEPASFDPASLFSDRVARVRQKLSSHSSPHARNISDILGRIAPEFRNLGVIELVSAPPADDSGRPLNTETLGLAVEIVVFMDKTVADLEMMTGLIPPPPRKKK